MKPVVTASDTIYNGRIFDIRTDSIREGDIEYKREIVVHKGSAVVVPIFDDGTVALVRQYRHAAKEFLLEIPAGTLNAGEDPKLGAIRELEEEIGVTAENIEKLTEFYVSPGFLTEKMHVFLATGLIDVGQKLEADELLTVERHSFDELNKMIRNGEITDAKTMLGIMLAEEKFRSIAR
ncbi:MAG: NUDIX hydrolase [Pyrinomonadaceae bacterium]|nr:NUDIX hydrolase [Pyrinomonadaceae bacterium]